MKWDKVKDWVRGTPCLKSATLKEWREWGRLSQQKHPVRYWLVEEAFYELENLLLWPFKSIRSVKNHFSNRFLSRTHALTSHPKDIKRGQWCEMGDRILPCLFNELSNFVEVDLAHINSLSTGAKRPWFKKRDPKAGLEYLRWAMALTDEEYLEEGQKHLSQPTAQALAAREIISLYHWWKHVYPRRSDPNDIYDSWREKSLAKKEDIFSETTPEEMKEVRALLEKTVEIENSYEKENEEMLIRLIKIRQHLWT